MGNYYDKYVGNPEGTPTANKAPTFDPNLGFENGRKPRVMIATKEEMDSARLRADQRDYCAHVLLKLLSCKSEHWPLVYKCHHPKEDYLYCEHQELKEYEREKRLLRRQQRIQALSG